jgi:GMP synthase (glutamine-hydrolysing)
MDETKTLRETFKNNYKMNVKIVKAEKIFLKNLRGITDPEKKRKIIGKTFITVLEKEAKKIHADFLVQGTIYPDVIESAGTKHSQKIKSHHNVGGLPKNMKLMLLEPLRTFYKDEVRNVGNLIGLSENIVKRQPFPGPGLAIRIIGAVDKRKLTILRKADAIVQQEIKKAHLETKLWQAFAVYTGIKTTGVRGDARCYGETIAIRALEATDAMSASWSHLPYAVLDTLSLRIVTEVPEVNRVVYDISNKTP